MGEGEEPQADANRSPTPFTPEERAEYDWWAALGHQAWSMIDEWEREESPHKPGEHDGT